MTNESDQPAPSFVTCPCQHCSGKIEFDATHAGEAVVCPHCNLETTLFVPPISEQQANPRPIPPTIEEVKRAELEQSQIQKIIQIKTFMRARLESGKPVFLYDSVFVPVDSELLDNEFASEFDVDILRKLGLFGWDVVQAVPKTKGIGLENIGTNTMFGSVWAGGIGGNVMGVHIIIKKSLLASDLTDDPADEVGKFIRNHLSVFLTE
jgi:hypothetical protein